jgi:hypothetical protein
MPEKHGLGSSSGGGGGPFRMEVKLNTSIRKRKRNPPTAVAVSAEDFGGGNEEDQQLHRSASPSSSSEASTVKVSNKQQQQQQQQQQETSTRTTSPTACSTITNNAKRDKAHQPDGWRVKLYRLNADGSWDDCGTGRVLCLRRPRLAKTHPSAPPAKQDAVNAALDAWICQELGEPTLCMHAEVLADATHPKILLRTRILLRDAYQRQGDNIITWCEPCYDNSNNSAANSSTKSSNSADSNNSNTTGGVDLALSFQDNAGCLDIWRQITNVQRHAAELYRTQTQQGMELTAENEPSTDNSNDITTDATISATEMAAKIAQEHHAELERQQHHEMWISMTGGPAVQQQHHHHQQQQHHNGFLEGDENNNPQQQQQAHHGHAHHHRPANKQQQHAMGEQHVPFEDSAGDMSPYASPNHSEPSNNNSNIMGGGNPNLNNAVGALSSQLPNPPTLANLEEIADTISRVQVRSY